MPGKITAYVDKVDLEEAILMLGVHRDTLKKWRMYEAGKPDGRKPSAATLRLVDVLMFALMLQEIGTKGGNEFYQILKEAQEL